MLGDFLTCAFALVLIKCFNAGGPGDTGIAHSPTTTPQPAPVVRTRPPIQTASDTASLATALASEPPPLPSSSPPAPTRLHTPQK